MADSAFKTQVSKDENANLATNPLFVQLTDGAAAVTVTGGKLDVNATVSPENVSIDDSAFGIATDSVGAIGMLADETSPDSVNEGDIGIPRMTLDRKQLIVLADATTDSQRLAIDASGRPTVNVNGTVTVDANSSDVTVDNGAGASAVNIQDGGNSITVDGSVSITGSVTVTATDLDIRDLTHASDSVKVGDGTDFLAVNTDGSINVAFGIGGTPVHDYATATPGAGASANNDYTVVGSTFELHKVSFSSSGKMKVEIQSGPVASLTTKAVAFAEKDTAEEVTFDPPLIVPVASTGTVRVIMTNRNGAAVDVYSTIMGVDKA
jgi:hypothetical protein